MTQPGTTYFSMPSNLVYNGFPHSWQRRRNRLPPKRQKETILTSNIANHLRMWAQTIPYNKALVVPEGHTKLGQITYSHYTFAQLEARSDALAYGLQAWGLQSGDRVLVFLRPSLAFAATLFALFKLGAVPVFIDPGM